MDNDYPLPTALFIRGAMVAVDLIPREASPVVHVEIRLVHVHYFVRGVLVEIELIRLCEIYQVFPNMGLSSVTV